jgi:hypothetical protein
MIIMASILEGGNVTASSPAATCCAGESERTDEPHVVFVVGTRIHLGKATQEQPAGVLLHQLKRFSDFVRQMQLLLPETSARTTSSATSKRARSFVVQGVIAVDATPRRFVRSSDGVSYLYDLVQAVEQQLGVVRSQGTISPIHVLPVQPWGQFVPALNALVHYAATVASPQPVQRQLLLVSLEATADVLLISQLRENLTPDTLVVGVELAGHEFHCDERDLAAGQVTNHPDSSECGSLHSASMHRPPDPVPLTGLTSPWNTLALWDVSKLAITGFQMISEGLIPASGLSIPLASYAGIEEVVTIALLQQLFGGYQQARAKLLRITSSPSAVWETNSFAQDPERASWHQEKMKSKQARAQVQLELFFGSQQGTDMADAQVHHITIQ